MGDQRRCDHCGGWIMGGPGGWYSVLTGREVCGLSPTTFHEHGHEPEREADVDTHEMALSANEDGWQVGCSCGWASPRTFGDGERFADEVTDAMTAAIEAWDDHCDVVFMEATARGL